MYFWDTEALKRELREGPLSQQELFKYLLAQSILVGVATLPLMDANKFDTLSALVSMPIYSAGVYYIYRCNGGPNGKRLLERFLSIGWVILIKFFVVVIALYGVLSVANFSFLPEQLEETTLFDVFLINFLLIGFYFIQGQHTKEVAKNPSE